MELIDNISRLLGDDLKQTLKPGTRLKIVASCFSMYAFEALKAELEKIDELSFIFTSPTFVANESEVGWLKELPVCFCDGHRKAKFEFFRGCVPNWKLNLSWSRVSIHRFKVDIQNDSYLVCA